MAFPKSFLLLGLLFAFAFLVSSHVSARELVETAQQVESAEEVKGDVHKDGYGYYGHHDGHGYGGDHGGHRGHYPPEKKLAEIDGYGGYGGYGHGGYGGYGHGGYGHGGYGYGHGGYGHGGYGHGGHGHYGPPKDEEKKN